MLEHENGLKFEETITTDQINNPSSVMLSEIFSFFSGTNGSPKSVSYSDHVIPRAPVRGAEALSYAECENWIGRRVVMPLIKFRYPQLGTIRYIGCDSKGILCAGIEFDNDIGGMSGKVNGQRLFECKSKHGLLVPVEYVSFLNNYDGNLNSSTLSPDSASGLYRTRSVPALSRSLSVKDFEPETVPGLKIGDTVVWLGGIRPMTGVVKWVGKDGRSSSIPLKAWVEMDDQIDQGYEEFDLGFKFGCAKGRGKLLSVDELILLENYLPVENVVSSGGTSPMGIIKSRKLNKPLVMHILPFSACFVVTETTCPVSMDLIDFGQNEKTKTKPAISEGPQLLGTNDFDKAFSDQINEMNGPRSVSPRERIIPIILETSSSPAPIVQPPPVTIPENTQLSNEIKNPAPPFIVSPIKINDFFQAEGLKGIQGRRNSCYIDVVLFAMFAFSDQFDSLFLEMEDPSTEANSTELRRISRKVLRENIVNPLRQNFYCPAESISILRDLLKPLSDKVDGAFMDVEEFMLILFNKVFKLDEFIVYENGVKDFLHQINLSDHNLPNLITVKTCLEWSMADYNLKLDRIPTPALILEIPRNNESVIQSTTIVPNLSLDISDLVKSNYQGPTRLNLLAVICIKEYHYVTFVKCGSGALSHWVLFDSNPSDEKPKVEIVPQMGECLESLEFHCKNSPEYYTANRHKLPPMVQRLLADMYVCIYC